MLRAESSGNIEMITEPEVKDHVDNEAVFQMDMSDNGRLGP